MVGCRHSVLWGCLCVAVLLSGCQISVDTGELDTDALSGDSDNSTTGPYVIGVQNDTETNVVGPLREAVAWWDEKEHEYDTAWEGEFVVRPGAEDPDLVARFAETVDCGGESQACAPNFENSNGIVLSDETVKIGFTAVPNRAALIKRLKHELGHVHGVSHCEPPHWLMGCPGSAEHEDKDYTTREFPWRSETNLTVHLDSDNQATRETVRAVLDEFERSPETPADLRFRFVDDPWLAHIVLSVEQCQRCGYSWDIPEIRGGQSYDSDGGLEFLYWADVRVTAQADRQKTALREALRPLLAPEPSDGQ
jgi:hypothetical protein